MGFSDIEPTDGQKALVDEALYLRGRIIASYAQVEFLLADLVVKLDLHFPYLIEARIKAVKKISERPGYEVYKEDLERLCVELSLYDICETSWLMGSCAWTRTVEGIIALSGCAMCAKGKTNLQ